VLLGLSITLSYHFTLLTFFEFWIWCAATNLHHTLRTHSEIFNAMVLFKTDDEIRLTSNLSKAQTRRAIAAVLQLWQSL